MPQAASTKPLPVKLRKIEELSLDPQNARKHGERDIDAIAESLRQFGQQTPLVITSDGTVIKGNGTLMAAMKLGWDRIEARQTALTGAQLRAYAIADNRTAELSEWDEARLLEQLQSFDEQSLIDSCGFSADEMAELLETLTSPEPVVSEDEVPEPPEEPVTKRGDLWILGEHRLLCGDSTKAEDVARVLGGRVPFLMVTDPPYGVEYDPNWRNETADSTGHVIGATATGKVQNDDRMDWSEAWELFPGAVAYVWHAGIHAGVVAASLYGTKFDIRAQIIWSKHRMVIGRGHYHWHHEPCWYAVKKGCTARWGGDRTQTTIWAIQHVASETGHGTQKPVECMARPIRNHGGKDDDVYDPFLGSGTTLIAAEQLNRRCYGLEIDPAYCDVIVARWEKLTGKKAERVEASS